MRLRHRTLYTQTCSNGNSKPGPINAKSTLFRNVKRFTESAPRLAGIDTTFDHVRRGALVARITCVSIIHLARPAPNSSSTS